MRADAQRTSWRRATITELTTTCCAGIAAGPIVNQDTYRRYTMYQRILAGLMLLGILGTIAGCNTMRGLGQDIERGGEKIQDKSAR